MEKENTMTKWGIIPQIQDWINIQRATNITHHNNELKKQKSHDYTSQWRKNNDKIQHPFI